MPVQNECPKCGADLGEGADEACPFCGARPAPPPGARLVRVIAADGIAEAGVIRSILEGSRIPAWIEGEHVLALWGGLNVWEGGAGVSVVVPGSLEEEARKVLCLRGIACQVTPGEVEALLRDHVRPALRKGEGGRRRSSPSSRSTRRRR